jgi:hypothetical protein
MRKASFLFTGWMLAAICVACWNSGAEPVRAQEHPPGSTAAQQFENIQVLKDLPAHQLEG